MTMRAAVPVLDARRLRASDAAAIVSWAAQTPDGWVWTADTHLGSDPHPDKTIWPTELQLSLIHAIRYESMRQGQPWRNLIGLRPDVMGVDPDRQDPGLRANWTIATTVRAVDAIAEWESHGWRMQLAGDQGWWRNVFAANPYATLYCHVGSAQHVYVNGVLTDMRRAEFQEWLIPYTFATARLLRADGLLVGVKPWEREGSDFMGPAGPYVGTNLVQPPPWPRGSWAYSISSTLTSLADALPVVTLTRPAGDPAAIGLGGTVVQAVTGEAALRGLSS